tara:strand:+ start:862 stop:1029 length:168 start_codon:yes stop_codon:yes gene_type:complete
MSKEKRLEQLKRVFKTWKAKEDRINKSYSLEFESLPIDLIQDNDEEIIDYLPNFA